MRSYRVLVADPEEEVRWEYAEALRREGFEVIQAGLGREVLEVVRDRRVDLTVLDFDLPVAGGFRICCEVRSILRRPMPILFTASRMSSELRRQVLHLGRAAVACRPLRPAQAVWIVQTIIGRYCEEDVE